MNVVEHFDIEIYINHLPRVDDDYFQKLCTILYFHVASSPYLFCEDKTMFFWEFFVSEAYKKKWYTSDTIIHIFSMLLNEQCFIDKEFIIFELDIFGFISEFLHFSENLYYPLDICIYFLYASLELEQKIVFSQGLIHDAGILEVLLERKEDNEESWLDYYIDLALEIIDKINDKVIENQ